MTAVLTLADIADHRQYERERDEFRARIIELKRRRRVGIGPFVTLLFENRDTIRFQVQEMARAERMLTDDAIQTELDIYNPLLPSGGELSATMFIELTSEPALREWLPRLVGIERSIEFTMSDGSKVTSVPEAGHALQLTRDSITSSVHYLRFGFTPEQVDLLGSGRVVLGVNHAEYAHETVLNAETVAELTSDLVDEQTNN